MHRQAVLALALGWAAAWGAVETQDIVVRLTTPIRSDAKAGARIQGTVTGCVDLRCDAILPEGSTIFGFVRSTQPVRFGVRRERSSLEVEFDGCALPDRTPVECRTSLVAVDNASETVTRGSRIHGILAANYPSSYLRGLWMRPTSALFTRSISGISGAGRMIYTGVSPHPAVGGAIIVARLVFLRLPEPEIHIPAGAELVVRVTGEVAEEPAEAPELFLAEGETAWLEGLPVKVRMQDGKAAGDIINLAFRGTEAGLTEAFFGAGWKTADALTGRTFARSYQAFTSNHPYPTAPVSPLRYQGRLPDLVFQKSFNNMAKRHHIRLWRVDSMEGPVWLGAATHDVGIVFDWKRLALTHRIDPAIDRERDKVLTDLRFAGCVTGSTRVERPQRARDAGRITTDGALHFVEPQTCENTVPAETDAFKMPVGKLMLRRTVLEARHYLLRGNMYYWAFRGLRSGPMVALYGKSRSAVAGLRTRPAQVSWRRGSESNRRMRALQTLALPLGYRAPR